MLSQDYLSGR